MDAYAAQHHCPQTYAAASMGDGSSECLQGTLWIAAAYVVLFAAWPHGLTANLAATAATQLRPLVGGEQRACSYAASARSAAAADAELACDAGHAETARTYVASWSCTAASAQGIDPGPVPPNTASRAAAHGVIADLACGAAHVQSVAASRGSHFGSS